VGEVNTKQGFDDGGDVMQNVKDIKDIQRKGMQNSWFERVNVYMIVRLLSM